MNIRKHSYGDLQHHQVKPARADDLKRLLDSIKLWRIALNRPEQKSKM
jgi:hypothetical protein